MHITNPEGRSLLASLRAIIPSQPLSLADALQLAERQATRLLELCDSLVVPVPTSLISEQPRIAVEHDPRLAGQAASGCTDWDAKRRTWVIRLNPSEPRRRRRFTVLHEYKHILDHYHPGLAGPLPHTVFGLPPIEYVADYFAGCALIPKRLLTAAYYDGIQDAADLAQLLDVSREAIQVRLIQTGLAEPVIGRTYQQLRRASPDRRARYYRLSGIDQMEVIT